MNKPLSKSIDEAVGIAVNRRFSQETVERVLREAAMEVCLTQFARWREDYERYQRHLKRNQDRDMPPVPETVAPPDNTICEVLEDLTPDEHAALANQALLKTLGQSASDPSTGPLGGTTVQRGQTAPTGLYGPVLGGPVDREDYEANGRAGEVHIENDYMGEMFTIVATKATGPLGAGHYRYLTVRFAFEPHEPETCQLSVRFDTRNMEHQKEWGRHLATLARACGMASGFTDTEQLVGHRICLYVDHDCDHHPTFQDLDSVGRVLRNAERVYHHDQNEKLKLSRA